MRLAVRWLRWLACLRAILADKDSTQERAVRLPLFEQPTTAHVRRPGLFVVSAADPWIERLEENTDFGSCVMLATACLRKDPGCIEAHLFLAAHTDDVDRRLSHLRKAVETGEQLWNPVAAELGNEMTWWGFADTRPYMRAIQALGDALVEVGDQTEARACYERLIAMNPNDNQGIRYVVEGLESGVSRIRL